MMSASVPPGGAPGHGGARGQGFAPCFWYSFFVPIFFSWGNGAGSLWELDRSKDHVFLTDLLQGMELKEFPIDKFLHSLITFAVDALV
ncbi:Os04g0259200 [Oryza sativa Japonica Group]|uniref:Os04g0259200 protein n=3 Tax=Oryza sativa TaxID=4530 RepID=A0A0P0W7W7_ORYSJ|nr:hypothetical protein OsI_27462 [Oryza sativa Indica Group]EEE60630.1 hypothetical protein OsJ_14059 [Oryza sativa Japonica Group]KAF2933097.1 hypothetical protein DAI22_04g056600 [Oryza sativa Japonica Group]BAF14243.1 Os04g0259200 [Oryza sativa Japonica Group]BAS88293.1 Os04g0259200 [Oryza sativa Japonica Group]|eukprot:NP_001052329.1 Os04g0259200 [Oryza sativa Japonica Group]